jgi:methyl-accepting chemotaxis protein
VADGDLDQQLIIGNQDEVGQLAKSFDKAVVTLHQTLRGVQISATLHEITTQLAVVSQQQVTGSKEQLRALTQVVVAMHQLGETAGQIATNSKRVTSLSDTTLEQIERVATAGQVSQERAQQMVTVVENTIAGAERIGEQVYLISEVMHGLNEQTQTVGRAVDLIGSVAKEVHLLSLNAAIEASGAGQYGERFKMVARQIKELADRTNKATEEVRLLVANVQNGSQEAFSQVKVGQAEVVRVVAINREVQLNLTELKDSAQQVQDSVAHLQKIAQEVSGQAAQIEYSTHRQYSASEQVIETTRSVEVVAEQSASSSRQIATSSIQLESLANQLNDVLSGLRLAAE